MGEVPFQGDVLPTYPLATARRGRWLPEPSQPRGEVTRAGKSLPAARQGNKISHRNESMFPESGQLGKINHELFTGGALFGHAQETTVKTPIRKRPGSDYPG